LTTETEPEPDLADITAPETARKIELLRTELLCANADGLCPVAQEELLTALAHLSLARASLRKLRLWQVHARTGR
jgi:hypothetical protein